MRTLNRTFLAAVHARDYSDPMFGALKDRLRGPFWAHLNDDLLTSGLPPLKQAVGHVRVATAGWQQDRHGSVYGLDWDADHESGMIGHLRVDG